MTSAGNLLPLPAAVPPPTSGEKLTSPLPQESVSDDGDATDATPESGHKVVTIPGWRWFKGDVKKTCDFGWFEQGGEVVH